MIGSPSPDELLLIEGTRSFLLAGRAGHPFPLCIETAEEEFIQGVEPDDLVVVSSPDKGPYLPAILLLELVRTYHAPLVVLPRDHPGSRRLKLVVSVAPSVSLSCSIQRGTHPQQHLLCSSEELAGITLRGEEGHITVEHLPAGLAVRYIQNPLSKTRESLL